METITLILNLDLETIDVLETALVEYLARKSIEAQDNDEPPAAEYGIGKELFELVVYKRVELEKKEDDNSYLESLDSNG